MKPSVHSDRLTACPLRLHDLQPLFLVPRSRLADGYARAVFPYMKEQGRGKIINISSGNFFRGGGSVKYPHYVASKGAVIGLTRALARELGEYNINVNCICPGYVLTGWGTDPYRIEFGKIEADKRCLKRDEYPEDLIGTAIFLASSDSDFITGQTIVVDGGEVML